MSTSPPTGPLHRPPRWSRQVAGRGDGRLHEIPPGCWELAGHIRRKGAGPPGGVRKPVISPITAAHPFLALSAVMSPGRVPQLPLVPRRCHTGSGTSRVFLLTSANFVEGPKTVGAARDREAQLGAARALVLQVRALRPGGGVGGVTGERQSQGYSQGVLPPTLGPFRAPPSLPTCQNIRNTWVDAGPFRDTAGTRAVGDWAGPTSRTSVLVPEAELWKEPVWPHLCPHPHCLSSQLSHPSLNSPEPS